MIPNPFRKFDLDKMRRSSDQLNHTMDFASVVSKRLMVFAVVICVLFGAVFLRLFQIQVLSHEEYTREDRELQHGDPVFLYAAGRDL